MGIPEKWLQIECLVIGKGLRQKNINEFLDTEHIVGEIHFGWDEKEGPSFGAFSLPRGVTKGEGYLFEPDKEPYAIVDIEKGEIVGLLIETQQIIAFLFERPTLRSRHEGTFYVSRSGTDYADAILDAVEAGKPRRARKILKDLGLGYVVFPFKENLLKKW